MCHASSVRGQEGQPQTGRWAGPKIVVIHLVPVSVLLVFSLAGLGAHFGSLGGIDCSACLSPCHRYRPQWTYPAMAQAGQEALHLPEEVPWAV